MWDEIEPRLFEIEVGEISSRVNYPISHILNFFYEIRNKSLFCRKYKKISSRNEQKKIIRILP